MSIYLIWLPS